jgi:hypothetical protein
MKKQKIGKGRYSVPSTFLLFTFLTELRAASPSLRHVQDLSSRVWILQNNILTAVPRKEQTVPGE